jgi:hypothetical protein
MDKGNAGLTSNLSRRRELRIFSLCKSSPSCFEPSAPDVPRNRDLPMMKLRYRKPTGKMGASPRNRRPSPPARRLQNRSERLGRLFRNMALRRGQTPSPSASVYQHNMEQGQGWTPSPPASINQRDNDLPHRVNVEIPESPDNDAMGWDVVGQAERAAALPPRNPYLYPSSKIVWSYEVETESEIYRVSTVPTDFLGNSNLRDQDWSASMRGAYQNYKSKSAAVDLAKANLDNAPVLPDDPGFGDDSDIDYTVDASDDSDGTKERKAKKRREAEVRDLQRAYYYALKSESNARADFLKVWPSAFGATENFDTHIGRIRKLEKEAREVQKRMRKYFYPR